MHRAERSGKTEVSFFTADVYFTVIRLCSQANSESGTKNFGTECAGGTVLIMFVFKLL